MDIKQLESFVCVAKTGSMTSAAQILYLSPPALAQQMNRLEKEVGTPLFQRSPRGMTLTPAGQVFYEDAQRVLNMTESMLRRCRETSEQTASLVRIGSVKGLVPDFYPKIHRTVRKSCPHIRLEHSEDTFENLRTALLNGQIDAFEFYDAPLARHPMLQYIPLITEGRSCLMTSDHPLAARGRITLDDLVGERVYVYEFERVPGLLEYVREHCPELTLLSKGTGPSPQQSGYYATLNLCEHGGICLITPHCAHHFAPLVAVPLDIGLTWSGGIICRKHMRQPMQDVLAAVKAEFAADAP